MPDSLQLVVLISGNGTNLQAIIDSIKKRKINAEIKLVISNRAEANGIERAQKAGINHLIIDHKDFSDRIEFDHALMTAIDEQNPDLVVLAGFMRILSDEFVNHYLGRLINIHPSLLPKYQGLNTHQRVIDAGEEEHGATVHYVIPELDSGPIILQASVPVLPRDDAKTLAQRVHQVEHQLFPEAIQRIACGQVSFRNDLVYFNGHPATDEDIRFRAQLD